MKKLLILCFIFLFQLSIFGLTGYEILWDQLLKNHVIEKKEKRKIKTSLIDYNAINNTQNFNTLIRIIESKDISSFSSRNHAISFWINIYNIGVIKLILEYYPINSIKAIPNFHTLPVFLFGEQLFSLSDIDAQLNSLGNHNYLFCLHNGTISGPDLRPVVYTADNLTTEMDRSFDLFLANTSKSAKVYPGVSSIYVSPRFELFLKTLSPTQNIVDYVSEKISPYSQLNSNKTYTIKLTKPKFDLNKHD